MTRPPTRRACAAGTATVLGLASIGLVAAPAQAASTTPFVSELHYDNVGADVGEFVEVQAAIGTDLSGWSLELYNGSNGSSYGTLALGGVVSGADASGDGVVSVDAPGLQNGAPDGLALVRPDGTAVEFLSYEGTMTAVGGPADGLTSTDVGVSEPGSPVGESLQRVSGTTWEGPLAATRGVVNAEPSTGGTDPDPDPDPDPVTTCDTDVTTTIPEVQGSGDASPLDGSDVVVRGVVTADLQDGLTSFTVQDVAGDGDPATSDAVYVFGDRVDVSVGDLVVVAGTVDEYFGLTELTDVTVAVCAGGAELPAAVVLPFPSTDAEREPFESMLVTPALPLAVSGLFALERFGEVVLGAGGPLVQGTQAALPGQPAADYEAANQLREIVLDDAVSTQNPDPLPYLSAEDSVRIGDVADIGPAVLTYSFGAWRLQPASGSSEQVSFEATVPRSPTAPEVGGDVTVAAFNVLNYFTTLASEDPDARGARDAEQLADQEAKIVSAISGLQADVVAVQEIQYGVPFGEDADVALAALTDALDAAAGSDVWDYVPSPDYYSADPDVIQAGIIYRSDSVDRVGDSLSGGADLAAWDNAREPVAQLFAAPDGDTFWVVSNHFKSKGGTGTGANADSGDGQAAFNADRVLQAQALAAFADELVAGSGEEDVLLMGDFNAYGMEDPITTLESAGFVDIIEDLDVYTYRFDFRVGDLDHAMLTPAAVDKVSGVDIWQVNAAEPFAYQYYSGYDELIQPYPYRASDHNPIVVGLDTEAPLASDVSLADVLAGDTSGPENPRAADGDDYDLLSFAVAQVLAAKPDSAVAVLADPTVALTAFLPNDDAFVATLDAVLPGTVSNEKAAAGRLRGSFSVDELEQILLGHVVLGQTSDSSDVLSLDGAQLTTAAGTTLTIDVRDDGSVAIIDDAAGNPDALLVLDALDINLGQVQVGHTVDRVLLG